MAKKLTSTKARKILHDKEVHGQPLTDKQRRFFGAIAGGAKPYKAQIGAMLTALPSNMMDRLSDALGFPQKAVTKLVTGKYQTPSEAMNIQSPAGAIAADVLLDPLTFIVGGAGASKAAKAVKQSTKTGLLSRAHEYNPWAFKPQEGVMMYRGIGEEGMRDALESGLIRSKQNTGIVKEKNFTISKQFGNPYFSPSFETANRYGQGYIAEVPISAANWRRRYGNPNKTWSQIASREIPITEGRILKKDWLRGYKEVKPPKKKKQDGGWLDKYDAPQAQNGIEGTMGGLTDVGFNYNGAWGGTMQMGGVLPGAVGFTYARTQSPAPSNGPYAKKTKASAQNGQEMKYYQEGLDFKPKTISQDGVAIDPMGYWNPENVGGPVIIPSTDITMQGVDQPLIGISNTGDTQYMEPGNNYMFDGDYVTEYPMARKGISVNEADAQPFKKLDQLLNFTNYNDMAKAKHGKTHKKAQIGTDVTGTLTGPQLTPSAQSLQQQQFNWGTNYNPPAMPAATKKPVNWAKGIPIVGKIVGGIQKSKEAKKLLQQTIQQEKLTDVMGQAAASRPVQQPRRQYVRPEDMAFQPEELSRSYGVGTNPFGQAEFGASVGGGEIANTFAPNTLYDNLGYEPLNDSERYKQFYHGGKMHKAQNGLETFMNQQGGNEIFGTIDQLGAFNDGGGDIGSGIGEAVGSFIPGAGPILSVAGRIIGSALDQKKEKTEASQERRTQNINKIAGQNFGIGVQQQFGASMEDGGTTSPYKWVSHTWQPQVIASFGEHKVKDLLKPPHDADMLRAGGHLKSYTPPSAEAMSTERPVMQMGGELQTHWGGYAEPMSYNPYLPDGGETIMFRGQSHDESDGRGNTGIGITYGENPVEVERGEPAVKLQDGTSGDSSLVVFGNLKIPKSYIPMLGEDAKGKKFKTYVADLSKKENKQNKKIDKATGMLEDFEVSTPIDKITLNSLQYTMLGANQKLKELADKKMTAASLQNAINDTAEEYGLIADDLAKGKVKIDKKAMKEAAKFGKEIEKAQFGFFGPMLSPILEVSRTARQVAPAMKLMLPSGASGPLGIPMSAPSLSKTTAQQMQQAAPATAPAAAAIPFAPAPAPIDIPDTEEEVITPAVVPLSTRAAAAPVLNDIAANIPDYPIATTEDAKVKQIMELYEKAKAANAQNPGKKNPYILELQKRYHMYFPEVAKKIILDAGVVTSRAKSKGIKSIDDLKNRSTDEILDTNLDMYFGPRTEQYIANLPKKTPPTISSGELKVDKKTVTTTDDKTTVPPTAVSITPYKRNPLLDVIGQVLPYLRPTNTEELDPRQLLGEMYALSTNQLEPVQAQTLQPQLSTPYDISLQDILNENEATFRSQQRMMGYNPAAQSMLNAQKYQANQKVLAEQFRLNQAEKQRVYEQNRNLLNQFGLQNLAILDRQYERQEKAKSITKGTNLEALKSIGDKFMRNQLENRKLATYENLYNYRYDPRFRAINMNAPFQPQIPTVYIGPDGKQYQVVTPSTGIPSTATQPIVPQGRVPAAAPSAPAVQSIAPITEEDLDNQMLTAEDLKAGYGKKGINVSKKKSLNSSVVKAFKNL